MVRKKGMTVVREAGEAKRNTVSSPWRKASPPGDGMICPAWRMPTTVTPYFFSKASVIARGRVRRVEDGAAMRKVLVALCMKYLPEHKDKIGEGIAREIDDTAIWAVDLEEVRGKGARSSALKVLRG